ncbi:MAG: hypothetical protein L0206_13545 [Actinobacteria bacterium]|nr:hypothetical protein [Actinomycetota bacterium]
MRAPQDAGRIDDDQANALQTKGYTCFFEDRDGDGQRDFVLTLSEPIIQCEPPKLIDRSAAIWTTVAVGWIVFAFAGTYARLARGGNPWAGFTLGGLLGIVGVIAAALVPVPRKEMQLSGEQGRSAENQL